MGKCIVCKRNETRSPYEYYCDQCYLPFGGGKLTTVGLEKLIERIVYLEPHALPDAVVKIKATKVVNENISAELGIPDTKDIVTIQCAGPSHDGQWVRRSSYNELADEARRRDKQLELALAQIENLERQLEDHGRALSDQTKSYMERIGELSMSRASFELEKQITCEVKKHGSFTIKLRDEAGNTADYVVKERSA